ncbi:hypothetical protein [Streptomyces sp. V2I9]|nr:hypothetical protein [Streptomyces sp. V2I9]MDQ0985360.1 hypothetical protein [Streptomyces sp. V2I9]
MSVSVAYPVFRTPDLDLALRVARRMVAFGVRPRSGADSLADDGQTFR